MNLFNMIGTGFNAVTSFLGFVFTSLFSILGNGFNSLLNLLEKPLSLLFYLLDGIFYFFEKLFTIVVVAVQIFVALFQFVGALIGGVFRTIRFWLLPDFSNTTNFPSASYDGFKTVIDVISPTGLTTVVPVVAIGFCWLFFVLKIISMFGGSITVKPFGDKGGD